VPRKFVAVIEMVYSAPGDVYLCAAKKTVCFSVVPRLFKRFCSGAVAVPGTLAVTVHFTAFQNLPPWPDDSEASTVTLAQYAMLPGTEITTLGFTGSAGAPEVMV
jgi:hypothetical protein